MILRLVGKEEIAEATYAFRFTPEGPLRFTAGQFGEFRLPDDEDPVESTRLFSLANAPHEPELLVATRIRGSAFKGRLLEASAGTALEFTGPMGRFTLPRETDRPVVFLVGGIGITPVRSMVWDALTRETGHDLTLLYANRTLESAAFHEELLRWDAKDGFTYVPVLSDAAPEDWPHERGRIDAALLRRHIPAGKEPLFYVVGPPGMVAAMKTLLEAEGVPGERIRSEDFGGY